MTPNGENAVLTRETDENGNETITITANFYLVENMSEAEIKELKVALAEWAKAFSCLSGSKKVNGAKIIANYSIKSGGWNAQQKDPAGNLIGKTTIAGGEQAQNTEYVFSWFDGAGVRSTTGDVHEIGHIFGLRDRYYTRYDVENNYRNIHIDGIGAERDIMGHADNDPEKKLRNLPQPVLRIIKFSNITKNKKVYINKNNTEK